MLEWNIVETWPWSILDDTNLELKISNFLARWSGIGICLHVCQNPLLVYIVLMVPIELGILFRVLLLIHPMVVNFKLRMMVEKKGIFLKNKISLLIVIFLLALIISLGNIIESFTPGLGLIQVVFPFNIKNLFQMFSQIYWCPLESLESWWFNWTWWSYWSTFVRVAQIWQIVTSLTCNSWAGVWCSLIHFTDSFNQGDMTVLGVMSVEPILIHVKFLLYVL